MLFRPPAQTGYRLFCSRNFFQKIIKMKLLNRYYVMRHGESSANKAGIIISHPTTGINSYGLTSDGQKQVEDSINASSLCGKITKIYTSDFLRAYETAMIAANICGIKKTIPESLLRERYFGKFEGKESRNYSEVWLKDEKNPDNNDHGVESTSEVGKRMLKAVKNSEQKKSKRDYTPCFSWGPFADPYKRYKRKSSQSAQIDKIS